MSVCTGLDPAWLCFIGRFFSQYSPLSDEFFTTQEKNALCSYHVKQNCGEALTNCLSLVSSGMITRHNAFFVLIASIFKDFSLSTIINSRRRHETILELTERRLLETKIAVGMEGVVFQNQLTDGAIYLNMDTSVKIQLKSVL